MAETLVHTLTVIGQYRLGAGLASGSSATYDTPGGKSVTIQHLRPVGGTELNFAISPAAVDAADFPSRIVATKQTGGVVEREFGIQAGSLRDISGGGNPASTIRQDYDPASGAVGDVFVSGQTIIVKLYYETPDPEPPSGGGETTETFSTAGTGTWTVPAGVTSVSVAFADDSGYGVGYWAEAVRSSSSSSLREDATGNAVWLRTGDGEPLEQEVQLSGTGSWMAVSLDTEEPDAIASFWEGNTSRWRARKTGKGWIPSNAGFLFSTIPWNGGSTYRFFDNRFNFGSLTANGNLAVTLGDTINYRVGDGSITLTYSSGPAAPNFADDTGDPVTWEQNTAIAVITVPAATGNPKPTYAAQGALPAGVTYTAPGASDDNGGTIRGTSTALGSGTITIRATNTQGSDDWTLAFTTRAPPPPGVLETVVGDGGTSGTKTWNPRPRPLIPASLVDGGGAAYLDQVSINDIGDYSLQTTSSASGGSGITAGPELTSRWENYAEALTISAGGVEIVIPGPNFSGFTRRDVSEPYSWSSPFSGSYRDNVNAFFAAYRALSQSARNSTRVELRDRDPAVRLAGRLLLTGLGTSGLQVVQPAPVRLAGRLSLTGLGMSALQVVQPAPVRLAGRLSLTGLGTSGLLVEQPAPVRLSGRLPLMGLGMSSLQVAQPGPVRLAGRLPLTGLGMSSLQVIQPGRFDLPITAVDSQPNKWSFANTTSADDDFPLNDSLRTTAAASLDYIRFRRETLQIVISGQGRFSDEVERNASFIIYDLSGASPVIVAVLKGISSYWNSSNTRYRIADDNAFFIGSRRSLDDALTQLAVNDKIRLEVSQPDDVRLSGRLSLTGLGRSGLSVVSPEPVRLSGRLPLTGLGSSELAVIDPPAVSLAGRLLLTGLGRSELVVSGAVRLAGRLPLTGLGQSALRVSNPIRLRGRLRLLGLGSSAIRVEQGGMVVPPRPSNPIVVGPIVRPPVNPDAPNVPDVTRSPIGPGVEEIDPWPFDIEWRRGFDETYQFYTEVIQSRRGNEQRIAQRIKPRRGYEFGSRVPPGRAEELYLFFSENPGREFFIPHFYDSVKVEAISDSSIEVSSLPPWAAPGEVMYVDSSRGFRFAQIESVSGNVLTVDEAVVQVVHVGSRIVRAARVMVEDRPSFQAPTRSVVEPRLSVLENPVLAWHETYPDDPPEMLNGREYFDLKPNWARPLQITTASLWEDLDLRRGTVDRLYPSPYTTRRIRKQFLLHTRERLGRLLGLFYRSRGQQRSWYAPSHIDDLQVAGGMSAGDPQLSIVGRLDRYQDSSVFRRVLVSTREGSFVATVEAIQIGGDDSVLVLDTASPFSFGLEDVLGVSWVNRCRFETDLLRLSWRTDGVAEATAVFRTLEDTE